jgi:hypothetical protein
MTGRSILSGAAGKLQDPGFSLVILEGGYRERECGRFLNGRSNTKPGTISRHEGAVI